MELELGQRLADVLLELGQLVVLVVVALRQPSSERLARDLLRQLGADRSRRDSDSDG